jgi:hypothetical protein
VYDSWQSYTEDPVFEFAHQLPFLPILFSSIQRVVVPPH